MPGGAFAQLVRGAHHSQRGEGWPDPRTQARTLLGTLLTNNDVFDSITRLIRAEHFYDPVHRRIFELCSERIVRNALASPVTLKAFMEHDAGLKELGGPAYLAQLTGSGAGLIGARDFASQIYDLALLRALIGVGRDMVESALDTSEEVNPRGQIEAALALGATRWEVIRMTVLPFGMSGYVAGSMLGLGRALGETIALYIIIRSNNSFIYTPAD